jgi:hypothetical protein
MATSWYETAYSQQHAYRQHESSLASLDMLEPLRCTNTSYLPWIFTALYERREAVCYRLSSCCRYDTAKQYVYD